MFKEMDYRVINKYTMPVKNLRELVYHTLRDQIMTMELKPGTIISTQDISDKMGVSRTPVREAFLRLQSEMLLEISPQSTTMVSRIDMNQVHQEHFIREALEMANLGKFIDCASHQTFEKMKLYISKQRSAIERHQYEESLEWDNIFHISTLLETGEELGADLLGKMNGHFDRFRLIIARDEAMSMNTVGEHEKLLKIYKERNTEKAKDFLRFHLQHYSAQADTLKISLPEYFKG